MNISEVERETVVDPETVGERISAGFSETMADISEDLEDFAVDFVVNLPYLLIWAVIITCIVVVFRTTVRRIRRSADRHKKHQSDSENVNEK